jgi:hypothetical protein
MSPRIDFTFVRIAELEFILQGEPFPVYRREALQSCDALFHRLQGNQVFVESDVTGDLLCLFISAVNGEEIELTNENIDGLSVLCGEFQFLSLSRRLDVFKNTSTYRLEQRFNALEANLQSLTNKMTSLEGAQQSTAHALTQLQESASEALLGRLAPLEADVSAMQIASALPHSIVPTDKSPPSSIVPSASVAPAAPTPLLETPPS